MTTSKKKIDASRVEIAKQLLHDSLFTDALSKADLRRQRAINNLESVASNLIELRNDGWSWDKIGRFVRRSAIANLSNQTIASVLQSILENTKLLNK